MTLKLSDYQREGGWEVGEQGVISPFLMSVLGERRRREQVFLSVVIISSTSRLPSHSPTSSTSSSLTSAPLSLLWREALLS